MEQHAAGPWRTLAEFELPSEPGDVRVAVARVSAAVADLGLSPERRDGLATAVAEAVANAVEHGSGGVADLPVAVAVRAAADRVQVVVTDRGGGSGILDAAEEPDVEAKLRGEQRPRGWGLLMIRSLVDEVHEAGDGHHHAIVLELRLPGGEGA